jgi:type I restriction enzyme R subunit
VNDCVDLLADTKIRAEFLVRLKLLLTTFELFRTRPEGRPYLRDVKLLGFIAKMASNLYRDEQLNLAGVGQKVRELIDEYIVAKGIDPKVPPTAITSAEFLKAVDRQPSKRAKASEMEHAARYHITIHFNEDPPYYRKLSERLEEILSKFKDNWDELIAALREFTTEVRAGRPADESGLDPRTQAPFLSLLVEEIEAGEGKVSKETLRKLAEMTVELVDHVRQEIRVVDFWRNVQAQNVLRQWIIQYLDQDVLPFERLPEVAGRLVELARALHTRLTA